MFFSINITTVLSHCFIPLILISVVKIFGWCIKGEVAAKPYDPILPCPSSVQGSDRLEGSTWMDKGSVRSEDQENNKNRRPVWEER